MKVRSVSDSTDRYVKGCVRAYLEGTRDLGWVASIIGTSPHSLARAEHALAALTGYGDGARRIALLRYLAEKGRSGFANEGGRPNRLTPGQ
jgi:hypothetical protein